MGYYIYQDQYDFHIKPENFEAARQAILHIFDNGGDQIGWVRKDEINDALTLKEMFAVFRWEVEVGRNGIYHIHFIGEKIGDDIEALFRAIAPFVDPDSYIEMRGEDGARWKYSFKNNTFKEVYGRMVWDDEET